VGEEVRVDVGTEVVVPAGVGTEVVVPVEATTSAKPSEPVGEEVRVGVETDVAVPVEAKSPTMPSKPVANKNPPSEPACQGRMVIEPALS
jgi:hypothetical protein